MSEKEIDELFRKAASSNQPDFDPVAWKKMADALDRSEQGPNGPPLKGFFLGSFVALLALLLGLLVIYPDRLPKAQEQVLTNSISNTLEYPKDQQSEIIENAPIETTVELAPAGTLSIQGTAPVVTTLSELKSKSNPKSKTGAALHQNRNFTTSNDPISPNEKGTKKKQSGSHHEKNEKEKSTLSGKAAPAARSISGASISTIHDTQDKRTATVATETIKDKENSPAPMGIMSQTDSSKAEWGGRGKIAGGMLKESPVSPKGSAIEKGIARKSKTSEHGVSDELLEDDASIAYILERTDTPETPSKALSTPAQVTIRVYRMEQDTTDSSVFTPVDFNGANRSFEKKGSRSLEAKPDIIKSSGNKESAATIDYNEWHKKSVNVVPVEVNPVTNATIARSSKEKSKHEVHEQKGHQSTRNDSIPVLETTDPETPGKVAQGNTVLPQIETTIVHRHDSTEKGNHVNEHENITIEAPEKGSNELLEEREKEVSEENGEKTLEEEKEDRGSHWSLLLRWSPDASTVASRGFGKLGNNLGTLLEYRWSKKWSVSTGFAWSSKKYGADGSDYTPPSGTWYREIAPDEIDGKCTVLDIPIDIRYYFLSKGKAELSVSTGLSSYLMLTERYDYRYTEECTSIYCLDRPNFWEGNNENKHLFGVYNLSLAYKHRLTERLSFQVEPFLKAPLSGIGYGSVNLWTTGAYIGVKYNFQK